MGTSHRSASGTERGAGQATAARRYDRIRRRFAGAGPGDRGTREPAPHAREDAHAAAEVAARAALLRPRTVVADAADGTVDDGTVTPGGAVAR